MYGKTTMKHERDAIYYTCGRRIDPEVHSTIEQLRRDMWAAAEREDYERAAELRDRLRSMCAFYQIETENKSE